MHLKKFNDLFLSPLTEERTKGNNKEVILFGDFNIDLVKKDSKIDSRLKIEATPLLIKSSAMLMMNVFLVMPLTQY